MIYLDNAASSYPKPREVYSVMDRFQRHNGANAGRSSHAMALAAAEMIYDCRKSVAKLFNFTPVENVIFCPSATFALNTVLQGLLEAGDHVITTDLEHNSVLRPLYVMQKKGVTLDIIETDLYDDAKTVERIAEKITPSTRALVITQCSNVCGKMMPIADIAKLKNDKIRLIVDGSQGAGSIPTDLQTLGVDYYCAPSHKGLLGPQGTGLLFAAKEEIRPLAMGGTGGNSAEREMPDFFPDRLEAGTLPTPAICGLAQGVKYLSRTGVSSIFAKKTAQTAWLYHKLKGMEGIELYHDVDAAPSPGVLSFNLLGQDSESVASRLSQKGICLRAGLHCAPLYHRKMGTQTRGMVRVSLGCFTNLGDLQYFVKKIKEIL